MIKQLVMRVNFGDWVIRFYSVTWRWRNKGDVQYRIEHKHYGINTEHHKLVAGNAIYFIEQARTDVDEETGPNNNGDVVGEEGDL